MICKICGYAGLTPLWIRTLTLLVSILIIAVGCLGKKTVTKGENAINYTESAQTKPQPPYPASAVLNREEGDVLLRVIVGNDCRLISVNVEKSSGHKILDATAMRAVFNWKFQTNEIGTNIETVSFKLEDMRSSLAR